MKFKQLYIIASILVIIGFSLSVVFYYFLKNDYYFSVPVTFSKNGFPIIDVEIEHKFHSLQVDIGSRFPLRLKQKVLNEIKKTHIGNDEFKDLAGNKYISNVFTIASVSIRNYKLNGIIAYEREDDSIDSCGKIGESLGTDLNLLIDFPNNRIIGCKNLKKLKNHNVNNWTKIPFVMTKAGITIDVHTDIGTKKMALCTNANLTFIRSDIVNDDYNKPIFHSSIYTIGNLEFNGADFNLLEFTPELNEVDGFIGMDFLKDNTFFLDYKNKFLFIKPPEDYFFRFPVTFSKAETPYTSSEIEGKAVPLQIDLGSSYFISLHECILGAMEKTPYGVTKWMDFKGNEYQSITYNIPKVKIGDLILTDVLVKDEPENFNINSMIQGDPYEHLGSIGREFLEKYNLFCNFNNNVVYACRTLSNLKSKGLISDKLIKVPFMLNKEGIILEIETEIGIKKFILDTGFTRTSLKKNIVNNEFIINANDFSVPVFITSKFVIGGHDFSESKILLLEISPEYEYDGFLGMDFLKIFPVYIDYHNRFIYIDIGDKG